MAPKSDLANELKLNPNSIDWSDLHDQLKNRPKPLVKQLGWQSTPPVLWSMPDLEKSDTLAIAQRHQVLKKKITVEIANDFVKQSATWGTSGTLNDLLAILQLAYGFDQICKTLDVSSMMDLANNLIESVTHFANHSTSALTHQLAAVELPSLLAIQFGVSESKFLERMDSSIDDLVDGDGWIKCDHLDSFEPLLCSWARCFQIARESNFDFEESTTIKLEWMTRQWIRLLGPEGSLMLAPNTRPSVCKEMLTAFLAMSTDSADKRLAKLRMGSSKGKAADGTHSRLHDGCGFSEWAGLGVLQSAWELHSPRIAVKANEAGLELEVANQVSLLRGKWTPNIKLDGKPVTFSKAREINVYHADEEVEFLELEYTSSIGCTLQRQILLARDEQFLLLADAVNPASVATIEYQATLPLAEGTTALQESDNREVYLRGSKIHSLVLPLALGEWKSDRMPGGLVLTDDHLLLSQVQQGAALYAPLFIDLSPHRCTSPRTWRSLTVAEELKILDRDQAAAYRVQVGDQQWLIYRSLSGIASRTFLGENQICEFFVGKTDGESAAEELIQLE